MKAERHLATTFALALALAAGGAADVAPAAPKLEKLALMDSLDMANWCDVETKEGCVKLVEDCLRPGSTGILWRDKGGGGWMRYPSKEEVAPKTSEYVIEKRRNLPRFGAYWALRLDNLDFEVFPFVYEECRRRNLAYGIHQTYEENHTSNHSQSQWTIEHPQFWNCALDGIPWPGHASLAYPEVMAHKLRFADEHIALKPQKIFIDMWRCGHWSLRWEYVKPNLDRWAALYPGEPPPKDWKDDRWTRLCAESTMAYLREYGRRCKAAGIQLVIGLPEMDLKDDFAWRQYGLDWKLLMAEGTINGIWVMNAKYDPARAMESTREILAYVKSKCVNGGKAYFGVNWYPARGGGIARYAQLSGCTSAEATRRLMEMLSTLGYAGAVFECLDCHCYPKDVCEELRKW
ncbi:MAG: hypothetical protein IKO72_14580 [Kiritimatiellae bacterium]|nr:hypothetical protein [Kiritimatiellia bacterium]